MQPAHCRSCETERMGNVAEPPTTGRGMLGHAGGLGGARTVGLTLVGGWPVPGVGPWAGPVHQAIPQAGEVLGPRIGDTGLRGQPVAEQRPAGPDRVMDVVDVVDVVDIGEHGDTL
jgi:hypothetical protein